MRTLLRTGLVPATTERLKLRRQLAAAAGKKESVSLSLVLVVNGFEVEEELSTSGHASLGRGNLERKMGQRAEGGLEEAGFSRFRRGGK